MSFIIDFNRLLRGSNTSTLSDMNPENKRRDMIILAALIEYPGVGLILFETGCAEDLKIVLTPKVSYYVMSLLLTATGN